MLLSKLKQNSIKYVCVGLICAYGLQFTSFALAADVTGAGATFPAPLYAKWAAAYREATGNKINYQSIGSGGGIKQIIAKTVDFGASDMPLPAADLNKEGLIQFPTVIGGVVPVVNIKGIKPGEMKLTGNILADIYLGKIVKWNDKEIVALNPNLALPEENIAVVRRADGSGTTFLFTNYLSKMSSEWKVKIGEGTAVQWQVGLGGKGNEGVSSFVQRIAGAIGYVEYAYAKQNKMTYALLKNASGQFVAPSSQAFKAAAAHARWQESNFAEILTDQQGKEAWPISGATFILMHRVQTNTPQASEVLKFFSWAYKNGDKISDSLDYVPLPDDLVKLIYSSWNKITDLAGKPVPQ